MKPSVGRIVHYVSYGTPKGEYSSRCVAAIITDIRVTVEINDVPDQFLVRLKIFNPDGDFNSPWLKENPEGTESGTWHWPERVEE